MPAGPFYDKLGILFFLVHLWSNAVGKIVWILDIRVAFDLFVVL